MGLAFGSGYLGGRLDASPVVYITDHIHSKVIGAAFAEGCKARIAPPLRLLDGPAIVYGVLRGCGDILHECQWVGRSFYHIDHGYMGRGHYDGFYRITKDGLQADLTDYDYRDWPAARFEALKIKIRPWRRRGRNIVVTPFTGARARFLGVEEGKWLDAVVREVSLHSARPIIIKPKDSGDLEEVLADAWCLVTHSSNAAVEAIITGVPAVILGQSAARPVAWRLDQIEAPEWPEREQWLRALAHHQFTLAEMRSGEAWTALNNVS